MESQMGMLPIQCGDGHNTAHCRCEGNNTHESNDHQDRQNLTRPLQSKAYLIHNSCLLLFLIDLRFWILEFGFKVFCRLNKKKIEQRDTADPQSKIAPKA
jgi:hypothetical protein